jgi:recombinational DNA repair protein (RecF pathway)
MSDRHRREPVTVAQIEVQPYDNRRRIEVQALTQRGSTPQTTSEHPSAEPLGPDELLTYAEAAAFLRCHPRTVKRYVHDGLLETVGRPPKIFVTRRGIAAYQEHTRRSGLAEAGRDAEA